MPSESFVQVAPDGSGKRVRNLEVQALQEDGTLATVYMQVVSLADEFGNPLLLTERDGWQVQMLDELRAVRMCLEAIYNDGQAEPEDFLALAQSALETEES